MGNENANMLCPCGSGKKYKNCHRNFCVPYDKVIFAINSEAFNKRPTPAKSIISSPFSGYDEGTIISCTTEFYVPYKFKDIKCFVDNIDIVYYGMYKRDINIKFSLDWDDEVANFYDGEDWKYDSIMYFLKNKTDKYFRDYRICPIFFVLQERFAKLKSIKLDNDKDHNLLHFIDNTIDYVFTPISYPPCTEYEKPNNEIYQYHNAKTTAIYSILKRKYQYVLSMSFEDYNAFLNRVSLFFPFGFVNISNTVFSNNVPSINTTPIFSLMNPEESQLFPSDLLDKYDDSVSSMRMPKLKQALPYRSINTKWNMDINSYIPEKLSNNFIIENYKALQISGLSLIDKDCNYDIQIDLINSVIPTRIYNRLGELPYFNNAILKIDVCNFNSNENLELEISSKIDGFSFEEIDNVIVKTMGGEGEHKAREIVLQKLKLNPMSMTLLSSQQDVKIVCVVRNKKTQDILQRASLDVRLLPKDFMLWKIEDPMSNSKFDLSNFIVSFVHSTDNECLIDSIRGLAVKYYGNGTALPGFQGNSGNDLEYERKHVNAIFDVLSKDVGIKYVNQPFYFGIKEEGQRITNPEDVIKNKGGNCIDLTLLFASVLEGLGFNSLIIMIPGHAFLGWGNKNGSINDMEFLECTMLGRDFSEAQEYAKKEFSEAFSFNLGDKAEYSSSLAKLKMIDNYRIIDVLEIKKQGKYQL